VLASECDEKREEMMGRYFARYKALAVLAGGVVILIVLAAGAWAIALNPGLS
jgi:hypothetical protein